jgi:hypothetical protein
MSILCRLTCATICVALLISSSNGQMAISPTKQPTVAPPLWDKLLPGPYAAVFKTLFRYDTSRIWKGTRTYTGKFSPDLDGRPVQIIFGIRRSQPI